MSTIPTILAIQTQTVEITNLPNGLTSGLPTLVIDGFYDEEYWNLMTAIKMQELHDKLIAKNLKDELARGKDANSSEFIFKLSKASMENDVDATSIFDLL